MLNDPSRYPANTNTDDFKGDIQTLLSSAREVVEQARHYDPTHLPPALATYARLLARDRQFAEACRQAKEILTLEQQTANAIEAIITMGVCAAYSNQIEEAESRFHEALELSRKVGYTLGLARALQYLTSLVLMIRGQFHLALTLTEEAGVLREELGSKQWNEPYLRGMIYQIVGDRRHARQVLDELVLQVEPGTRLAAAYYLLWARVTLDEGELEQAKEYLRLGLRVANRIGVMDLNLWTRLEHSRLHRLYGDPAVARHWADDALQQAQQYDSQYFIALSLMERAQAHWNSGNREQAEADLAQVFSLLQPLRAEYDLARAYFLRAFWRKQSGHPEAEAAWLDAVQQITRNGYAFLLEKEQDVAFPLVAEYLRSKTVEVRKATDDLLTDLARVLPPPLRIHTLGQFAVWKGRQRIPDAHFTRRKAGELMRYLLLQPNRAAGRELIIEALWPDHDSDNPSDLLNQATSNLRRGLEPDLPDKFPSRYLKVEGELISLQLPPGSTVDFEHFERVLPIAIQTQNADRLQEALNLYSGDLFPSDRYADWSEEKRHALAELRQRGLLALAKSHLDGGQNYQAINCCRSVLHADPWNEDAALLGIQAYLGLNDAVHALLMYQELETVLRKELNIAPRADLRALAKEIRTR